eukprot:240958-Rhodomonas_salina.1
MAYGEQVAENEISYAVSGSDLAYRATRFNGTHENKENVSQALKGVVLGSTVLTVVMIYKYYESLIFLKRLNGTLSAKTEQRVTRAFRTALRSHDRTLKGHVTKIRY